MKIGIINVKTDGETVAAFCSICGFMVSTESEEIKDRQYIYSAEGKKCIACGLKGKQELEVLN